jgi:hypothetical protein
MDDIDGGLQSFELNFFAILSVEYLLNCSAISNVFIGTYLQLDRNHPYVVTVSQSNSNSSTAGLFSRHIFQFHHKKVLVRSGSRISQ